MIYLASPIDFSAEGKPVCERWRSSAKANLTNAGLGHYDPSLPFGLPVRSRAAERQEDIDAVALCEVNRAALRACSGLLALLPDRVRSVGVPAEVQAAGMLGKRVAVVHGKEGPGFYLRGLASEEGVRLFREWEMREAARWLAEAETRAEMQKREIKWVGQSEFKPRAGWRGDAGFDLWVSEDMEIEPGTFVDVPCGVSVELPEGVWALITGRSSTLRKRGLLVVQGVIDQGYRGPLFAGVQSLKSEKEVVQRGERLAQLIPMVNVADGLGWRAVEQLGKSDRGADGFGSTGV